MLRRCWFPKREDADPLLWSRDIDKHYHGEFSFAMVQANEVLEDQAQVETGERATYVGVYDGHNGREAAQFISTTLFHHLQEIAKHDGISQETIERAFFITEKAFYTEVWGYRCSKPKLTEIGSCCLVGVIWGGKLYTANLGDSRAVLCQLGPGGQISAQQLTADHNVSRVEVRQELMASHPNDPGIVSFRAGVWRIKDIIQVSRAIGDWYLKDHTLPPVSQKCQLPQPLKAAVLRADPDIFVREIEERDRFIIFASDGLWEHLNIQDAAEVVHSNPRPGIAKRLIVRALITAAQKNNTTYKDIKKAKPGRTGRRRYHDDITVVVLFINDPAPPTPTHSILGFSNPTARTTFNI